MPALAAVGQLTDRLASPPDLTRAARALDDASAVVRAYCGQSFTRAVSTERVRLRGGVGRLSQRPVRAVTGVTSFAGVAQSFTWDGADRIYLTTAWPLPAVAPGVHEALAEWVTVTYDHGYDEVPADVVAVVCNMAARALGAPPEQSGINTESITNYSVTLGPVGAAGAVGLFGQEQEVLDRYRRSTGVIWAGR